MRNPCSDGSLRRLRVAAMTAELLSLAASVQETTTGNADMTEADTVLVERDGR